MTDQLPLGDLLTELDEVKPSKRSKAPAPYRYMRVEDFNPDSWQQIQDLAKHLGVKLPRAKDSDDEDKLSTEKRHLKQAAKKFPVFNTIIACKERWKMISTYKWALREDSTVPTTLGHHPSSWRKSSRSYNLQNIPKRSALAEEFRRMIIAPPGHVILEADSSAIEAVLTGYYAGSERLMNLARAGIHDWFNAHVHQESFSCELPLDELRSLCRAAKKRYSKESREVAKRCVHASNYKISPREMHDQYPEEFPTEGAARKMQNLYLDTAPGHDLQRWWKTTCDRAAHDRFLMGMDGARHRFFHVYGWNRRTHTYTFGDDAKRAIAFLPQNAASMIQDQFILDLWATELGNWMHLPVHDSLLFYVPWDRSEDAAKAVHEVFVQKIPELGGLSIGAEISISAVGGNWAPRSPDNPGGMETWNG